MIFIKLTGKKNKIPIWIHTDKIIYFEPYLGNANDGATLRLVDGTILYVRENPEEIIQILETKHD